MALQWHRRDRNRTQRRGHHVGLVHAHCTLSRANTSMPLSFDRCSHTPAAALPAAGLLVRKVTFYVLGVERALADPITTSDNLFLAGWVRDTYPDLSANAGLQRSVKTLKLAGDPARANQVTRNARITALAAYVMVTPDSSSEPPGSL